MHAKLWTPLESVKLASNLDLSDDELDQELLGYVIEAQNYFAAATRRDFDAEKVRTEYKTAAYQESLVVANYPIVTDSISLLRVDTGRDFDSSTQDLSSDEYFIDADNGMIWLRGVRFPGKDAGIKITYSGGYYSEKEVVALASAADNMTVADDLSSYEQPFSLFVHTTGTATSNGAVSITGTDENGDAQTETILPNDKTESGKATLSFSKRLWLTITDFDAANLSGASVRVSGCSFPPDIQLAIRQLASFWFNVDEDESINTGSRSIGGRSATFDDSDIPSFVQSTINRYKRRLPG